LISRRESAFRGIVDQCGHAIYVAWGFAHSVWIEKTDITRTLGRTREKFSVGKKSRYYRLSPTIAAAKRSSAPFDLRNPHVERNDGMRRAPSLNNITTKPAQAVAVELATTLSGRKN